MKRESGLKVDIKARNTPCFFIKLTRVAFAKAKGACS